MNSCDETPDPLLEKSNSSCLFCFDQCVTGTSFPNKTQKLFEKCSKYLHSTIVTEISKCSPYFDLFGGNAKPPFCEKCSKSTVELCALIEQLEVCQKNITELTFMFSLGVLSRRRKFSGVATKDCDLKKKHNFEISDLNDNEDFDNDLDSPSSLHHADCRQISSPDDLNPLHILSEFEMAQHFNSVVILDGLESPKSNGSHENIVYCDTETSANDIKTELLILPSPFVEIAKEKSSNPAILSKEQIKNSSLPIVRLKKLGNIGNLTKGQEGSKNNVKAKNCLKSAPGKTCYSRCRKYPVFASSSSAMVNESTIAIKTEAVEEGTTIPVEKEGLQIHNVFVSDNEDVNEDNPENIFACFICVKRFVTKQALQIHQLIHQRKKRFSCTICNKEFSSKQTLSRHHRIHTGENLHVCSTCGKSFCQKYTLKNHQRLHTGEKPFPCFMCFKSFSQKHSLTFHERLRHTGEKPFTCSFCSKSFITKAQLKCHQRIHTGEKV